MAKRKPKKRVDLSGHCGDGQIWDPKAHKCIDASKLPGGPILTRRKKPKPKDGRMFRHT